MASSAGLPPDLDTLRGRFRLQLIEVIEGGIDLQPLHAVGDELKQQEWTLQHA